ncbi:MAG: CrcB protein [Pseudohongiellaceae bacterium]|jgi:CrcB protein
MNFAPTLTLYLSIAAGGAVGAMSRYWLSTTIESVNQTGFPLGTLIVNTIGSFLIGLCFAVLMDKVQLVETWRPLLMIGFLGAMTTFSTFSLDALLLFQQGHYNTALIYTTGSVVVCLFATFSGMHLAKLIS